MQIRLTQRFAPSKSGIDLESSGANLAEHARKENRLDLVRRDSDGGRLVHIYEGFATAEPDAGHKALNMRGHAEALGLEVDGEAIEVLELPGDRPAAWTLSGS